MEIHQQALARANGNHPGESVLYPYPLLFALLPLKASSEQRAQQRFLSAFVHAAAEAHTRPIIPENHPVTGT